MASANTPLPNYDEFVAPTYPFLYGNGDETYTYRSDAPANLWSFLDAIDDEPQLALRVTVLQLTLEYDSAVDLGIMNYIDEEAVLVDMAPQSERDYESEVEFDEAPKAGTKDGDIEEDATSTAVEVTGDKQEERMEMDATEEVSEVYNCTYVMGNLRRIIPRFKVALFKVALFKVFIDDTDSKQPSPKTQLPTLPKLTPRTDETGYTYEEALALSIAEGHPNPLKSDSSSSSSSSFPSSATQEPTVVFSHDNVPIARSNHYIKDRLQLLVQDIELIRSVSRIDSKEEVPDHLHVKMWQSLLSICENVRKIVVPIKWADKLDPRFFSRLEVMVIKGDDNYE